MLSVDFTNLDHKNYHLVTYTSPSTTAAGGSNTKSFLQAALPHKNITEPSSLSSSSNITYSTATASAATATTYIWDSSVREMDNSSYITQSTDININNINNNNNNNNNIINNGKFNNDHFTHIYNHNIVSAVSDKNVSDDSMEYALKIKEIEDYYLKSLLNEDTNSSNNNVDNSHSNLLTNNNNNYNSNNSLYSNHHHSSPVMNNQNQINLSQNGYQLPQYDISNQINISNNNNNNHSDRRNLLEVDINHSFNHSLPLTTENLQKLSLSNNHTNNNIYNYNSNTSPYYMFSNQFNNNNSNHTNHSNNILSNTLPINVSYPSQILPQQSQKQQQNIPLYNVPVLTPPPLRQQQQQQQAEINKQLYKTELCESFTTKGFCKYGSKCQFAHGLNELKFKQRSNNFRTKPCINWDKLGYCPYGKRCLFKHGDDRDIKIYVKAGAIIENSNNNNNNNNNSDMTSNLATADSTTSGTPYVKPRHKNLHANVKRLQKITW